MEKIIQTFVENNDRNVNSYFGQSMAQADIGIEQRNLNIS